MSTTAAPSTAADVRQAVLTATGTAVTLVLAEWFNLAHANQAVWTTYLVMVSYSFTQFQKGVERVVGRAIGIFGGLLLATFVNDAALLCLFLMGAFLVAAFYVYFAGRLAYTALNAGLYLVAVFHIAHAAPDAALDEAEGLFYAIVLGVAVADGVAWLTGFENDLRIVVGTTPLLPLRFEWLNQSVMLTVTVLVTMIGAHAVGLPPGAAAISVMMLTVTPHLQAMVLKGQLRVVGLLLASAWALLTFGLLSLVPALPLLVLLIFLGELLAAYLARVGGAYSYAGIQMGLVLPMVVVVSRTEFGSFTPALQRLSGVLIGALASVLVAGLWFSFPLGPPPPPDPPPNPVPGEIDV